MSKAAKPTWLRDFFNQAEQLDFVFDGFTGGGHIRLYNHPRELTYITSASPSDKQYQKNALADMERMSGHKLAKPNAAKYRFKRQEKLDTRMTVAEWGAVERADELRLRSEELREQWAEVTSGKFSRDDAAAARAILTEYEEIRGELGKLHRIIPPLAV
jgi:hypothetical protein